MSLRSKLVNAVLGLLLLAASWYALSATGLVSKIFLPSPRNAFNALTWGFTQGDLAEQTAETTVRMLWGWLIASLIAIALGALMGVWRQARDFLAPLLEFIRPLPASAVVPVALVLFGLTPGMVIGVIAFGSLWPTLLATAHGFASIDPRLQEVAKVLGLSRFQFIVKIGLPNAVPDVLAGMRLSLTIALILAIVGEMMTGQSGLGTAVLLAGRAFQSADLFAGLIVLGLIGLVTNTALQRIERHLLRWRA